LLLLRLLLLLLLLLLLHCVVLRYQGSCKAWQRHNQVL
jgi:hypothetical protein